MSFQKRNFVLFDTFVPFAIKRAGGTEVFGGIIPPMTVSRREFLKGAGVTGLASAVTAAGVAETEAQTGPRVLGPGDVPVSLMVNGKRLELKIEPRVTLLDAVRNRADLTGNKRVCHRGTCGACT